MSESITMVMLRRLSPVDVRWVSAMLMLVVLSSLHVYEHFFSERQRFRGRAPLPRMKEKLILSWTGFFQNHGPFMTPSTQVLKKRCGDTPVSCHVTSNRRMEDVSDAILFHWRDVKLVDLPAKHPRQRWVLLNFESPHHVRPAVLQELGPSIDWMATYRLDSDVQAPYGRIRLRTVNDAPPTDDPREKEPKEFSKKLLVAWMVSNCQTPSHREFLVEQLRKHIDVDMFGRCEGNESLLEMTRDQGYAQLAKRYKFYLAFENSICRDYATEKAFQPLYHGFVPVVYGGADYRRILPPNSYIDVLDFSSAANLAEHLIEVGSNWTIYSQYLQWKKDYVVEQHDCENVFFCQMCSMLNREGFAWHMGNSRSGEEPLSSWWNKTNDCANVSSEHLERLHWLKERRRKWFIGS